MKRREMMTDNDKGTLAQARHQAGALAEFHYKNGYTLSFADLGKAGVKIELSDANEASAAVILPPEKTEEASRWLSKTIAQRSHLLPDELTRILGRLLKQKEPKKILERGDKKVIKEALKLLAVSG